MSAKSPPSVASLIDTTTILSLLSTVLILGAAYAASIYLLPKHASTKIRILFVWHAFDSLIHTFLEGGFLYNCFFTYATNPIAGLGGFSNSRFLPSKVAFLGQPGRLYGAAYGKNALAALWREYAKADARWGEIDVTVVSLELLTVLIGAPLAAYICYCLVREPDTAAAKGSADAKWFWMIALATGELYGGFMTFAPEWLTGNPNLETGNWLYLWVYLVFFNMLWVFIPIWVLYESYQQVTGAADDEPARKATNRKRK